MWFISKINNFDKETISSYLLFMMKIINKKSRYPCSIVLGKLCKMLPNFSYYS